MSCSIEESKDGDEDEEYPPAPEDEEEILIKEVVGKNAEETGFIIAAPANRAGADITSNLSREQIAHWVWCF